MSDFSNLQSPKIDVLTKARWALESGQLPREKADLLSVALVLADESLSPQRRAEAQGEWDSLLGLDEPFSSDPDYVISKAARRFEPTDG